MVINTIYIKIFALITILLVTHLNAQSSQIESTQDSNTSKKESPWLAVPLVSSGPKMGSSLGAMVAYLHKFDKDSPTSTFAAVGTYSNTDSSFAGIFAKTFFDNNKQRLMTGIIFGTINNEYNDYLGTGLPVNTTDNLHALFLRYSYQFFKDIFIGGQFVSTNYSIIGNDLFSNEVLNFIGLDGFESNGLGLTAEYDSRDNINSPSKGSFINLNNLAYRKSLGGDVDFDVLNLKARYYYKQNEKLTLAMRLDGKWTSDAPAGAYASVDLRGYTSGQYLAPHSTTIELEERLDIAYGIGATLFGGVSCLYNNVGNCSENMNLFPSIGAGINYMMKKEEKMVVRLEGAVGKDNTYGIYLQFGRAF